MANSRNGSSSPAGDPGTTTVHLSLQGKGGVGKSLVASLLAQYFRHRKGISVRCIDADPVNQTLAQYNELGAERLDLMREGSVDQRAFDGLMESLLTESGTFIVDNGASTFIPLWNYMLENNAVGLLKSSGRRIFLHCVLTGGQALADTLSGFARLAQTTGERNIVLWVNEYFGRVERDGRPLSELPVYIEHASSVVGSVAIPLRCAPHRPACVRKRAMAESVSRQGTSGRFRPRPVAPSVAAFVRFPSRVLRGQSSGVVRASSGT